MNSVSVVWDDAANRPDVLDEDDPFARSGAVKKGAPPDDGGALRVATRKFKAWWVDFAGFARGRKLRVFLPPQ